MLKAVLIVGSGSFLGGAARYLLSQAIKSSVNSSFPWGTLTVNILGCLLIGLLYGLFSRYSSPSSQWCLLLTTGLCGGFTTFSTFSQESLTLLQSGNTAGLILYILASVVVGILAVLLGHWIVEAL